jgi:hypothetical protein
MPNHVSNIVEITGEKAKEVIDILFNENDECTFDNFFPMPKELANTTSPNKESNQDLIDKFGADNWYDWKINNYGTKWGIYEGNRIDDTNMFCQSAWGTPYKAFLKLSEVYPDVEISVQYADEDFGHNTGKYTCKGGDLISEYVPDGGSKEAIKNAMEVDGGDYYLTEYLADCFGKEDLEQELEDGNEFTTAIVDMVIEEKICPNGKDICEVILEIVKDRKNEDDFEYLSELQKEIALG